MPVENSHSNILVVQPTQNWYGQRVADCLDGAGDWRVFLHDAIEWAQR